MMRVAIIGCGKVAEQHAMQISRIPEVLLVGVCDKERLMALQMQERFGAPVATDNLEELIYRARPSVVHITTPPQSHYALAKACIEAGCHVYVEKPFTINSREAEELISFAGAKGLKLTAGHNMQFTLAATRMRRLVASGFLGGPPVHMEAYYGYDLGDPTYAKALLGDKNHWVRKLPGGLLQNVISHAVAKIAEFLEGEDARVTAVGFSSPILKRTGETDMVDELRAIISDGRSTTAYLTFSTGMRPAIHQFRIFGPQNGLEVDEDHQTVIRLRGSSYKSYLEQLIPPFSIAINYAKEGLSNAKALLTQDLHNDMGMKSLMEAFYHSIERDSALPISYREILLTARIMDKIFEQTRPQGDH